jgi:hypothetical protein
MHSSRHPSSGWAVLRGGELFHVAMPATSTLKPVMSRRVTLRGGEGRRGVAAPLFIPTTNALMPVTCDDGHKLYKMSRIPALRFSLRTLYAFHAMNVVYTTSSHSY